MPPTQVSPAASGTPSPSPPVPYRSPWGCPPHHGQHRTSGVYTHWLLASAPQVASGPLCTPCGLSIGGGRLDPAPPSLLAPLTGYAEPAVYRVALARRGPSQARATTAPMPVGHEPQHHQLLRLPVARRDPPPLLSGPGFPGHRDQAITCGAGLTANVALELPGPLPLPLRTGPHPWP
ncbi:hypothetical protein NDU88_009620 [Pleurodeles waltl]|uniref:Uncharacterized protein n=1 Tax=Pleurodeles waltl TaxID=8319 RepID=A0AAV7QTI7_PLEWA|nr:hypothetical protein NDU88_009620 [Pleurodeles waltl]